jgi:hypothetical protein
VAILAGIAAAAQPAGFLEREGQAVFPIGFYELPADEEGLRAMAEAGVNLVRCRNTQDLDRAHAAGMLGWVTVPVHLGDSDAVKTLVDTVAPHPALAVWEGPDEIVWHFTAASVLKEQAGIAKSDWWEQRPNAVNHARERAAEIMPNIHAGIGYIRSVDTRNRPVWFNEARDSDVRYVRMYLDAVDMVGCDDYPVGARNRDIARPGRATDRWVLLGRGKPVWMVLQAFSWHELNRPGGPPAAAYPSFGESRFMAWDCIAHGASGLLYWGSGYLQAPELRGALYALTRELAALQPLLTGEPVPVTVTLVEAPDRPLEQPVRAFARRNGNDWLVAVVNADTERHMGVEVAGLGGLNGRQLVQLYGDDAVTVCHGEIVVRMQARSVAVYATSRDWETPSTAEREYAGE